MITVLGLDTDRTFLFFLSQAAHRHNVAVRPINLRAVASRGDWKISLRGRCFIAVDNQEITIAPGEAVYARIIDISDSVSDPIMRARWQNLTEGLTAFLEMHEGMVINRPLSGAHNGCKPLHELILQQYGFMVPDSITSARKNDLIDFADRGPAIVKTISGIRASCRKVTSRDITERAFDGPIHVQRLISGFDVRVHVVGTQCFALKIDSGKLDYRDFMNESHTSKYVLPEELARKLVAATHQMGLAIAGWDFKVDNLGQHWCLEANPMPGYSGYDAQLGGVITEAMIKLLREEK